MRNEEFLKKFLEEFLRNSKIIPRGIYQKFLKVLRNMFLMVPHGSSRNEEH
jgi:hypothetical protein